MASIDAWRDMWRRPLGRREPPPAADASANPPPRAFRAEAVRPDGSRAVRAVRANAGLGDLYRRKLVGLVDEMHRSIMRWLVASYRRNEPEIALDALPAAELQRAIEKLASRWQGRFDEAAVELAKWFATRVEARSSSQLMSILRRGGWTVKFRMTRAMRDVLRATVEQNVALIRSIPRQQLGAVAGAVMRSVQAGRDLESLTRELVEHHGVARRRAEFIALDQNQKATAMLTRARQVELGLDEAEWMHSHAGKEPRPTHVANHGKRFSLREGWFDPDPRVRRRILPGELPRCRCSWRPIVKGFK